MKLRHKAVAVPDDKVYNNKPTTTYKFNQQRPFIVRIFYQKDSLFGKYYAN